MNSADVVITPGSGKTWLGKLAGVAIRPRRTMRRILDAGSDRMVVPLVLLSYVSAIFGELSIPELRRVVNEMPLSNIALVVAGVLLIGPLIVLLIFYGLSWLVARIGRLMDGQGGTREVRSAMAWGLAPSIWALLYRIPLSFFRPAPADVRGLPVPALVNLGAAALAFGLIELLLLVWYLIVTSATIGEAHRFSTGRGFASLMAVLSIPFILLLALVLTRVT